MWELGVRAVPTMYKLKRYVNTLRCSMLPADKLSSLGVVHVVPVLVLHI